MPKARMWVLLGVLSAAIFAVVVGTAFGEFESAKTKGNGESIELGWEAGGGKVVCQNFPEPTKNVGWAIKKEGKETTKAPGLLVSIGNWGACTLTGTEFAKTKATLNACELEISQSGSETAVSAKLLNNCTASAGGCEIKAEAAKNEGLTSVNLSGSGEESKNTIAELLATNLTTSASGTCHGIAGTTKGKFTGWIELNEVQQPPRPEFSIVSTRRAFNAAGQTATVTVKNISANAQVPSWGILVIPGNAFSSAGEQTCKEKNYAARGGGANSECSFTIEFKNPGAAIWGIIGMNGGRAQLAVAG